MVSVTPLDVMIMLIVSIFALSSPGSCGCHPSTCMYSTSLAVCDLHQNDKIRDALPESFLWLISGICALYQLLKMWLREPGHFNASQGYFFSVLMNPGSL